MSEPTPKEVRGVVPSYIGLLMGIIHQIWTAWDDEDLELGLKRACRLYYLMVDKLKEQLSDDVERITKEMNRAYRLQGVDFYTTQLKRNRVAKAVAFQRLEPFMDKMVRLLDDKGWLERGSLGPRYPGTKKLSVESIEH